jgi:hypothetical protein
MSQHTGYSGALQREVPPGGARSWPRPGSPPDYLDALDGGPPWPVPQRGKRRIRRTVAIAAAVVAALVVVLGAAGFTAYTLLAGSGVALDRQVPADAVAFAEINLDPPAGQKIAAMRFLGHLRGGSVSDEDGDLTGKLVEPVIQSPDDRRKFVEDVKPWLGKHAAVSAERRAPGSSRLSWWRPQTPARRGRAWTN